MKLKLEPRKIGWNLLAGMVCGALVWALSVPVTGLREPFDSPGYYYITAMFIAGTLATLPAPRYWWVAVIGIFLGEGFYAFAMLPETRAWLAFGFVMNLFMLTWLASACGALTVYVVSRVRRRRFHRRP